MNKLYSAKDSLACQTESGKSPVRLVIPLQGYLPSTRNQLNGCHWSNLLREKKRAAFALRDALRLLSQSTPSDHATGMVGTANIYRIGALLLDSSQATDGTFYLVGCCPERFQRKSKKKR